jgi:bifunctional ADP-heptose synthase (sugar kinase/adenylyltransferase)
MNIDLFLNEYKNKYSINEIKNYINDIEDVNILVIGETIIDEYQYGYTLGKAGKFPIVAFQNEKLERYDGGVLAIYNHLKDFCNIDILTGWKQIVKKRYVQNGQKLFETYETKDNLRYNENEDIEYYDLIIVADFGHGFIDKNLREEIQNNANYLALNTQLNAGNEGLNTIQKYNFTANYICIDSHELRLALSNQEDPIEKILEENFNSDITISITRGKDGCIIYRNGEIYDIPPFATKVIDAVGAGDAFLAITSPLVYKEAPLDIIGFIGNCAGALAVEYSGNKEYIDKNKLIRFIEDLMK